MIGDFHFLRPDWLLALLLAAGLAWIVSFRDDVRARWRGTIAPHLLDHLVIGRRPGLRLRPVHFTALLIALGAVAAAGPTWEQERPPFVEDKAPLAIAIDLSATMDAIDVTPSRIERAKLKVSDLLALRPGARTAVFAYAGTSHLVLPLTDDAALIRTYVDSLATAIMPVAGKDTAKALATVEAGLAREETPGTILFVTDGVEPNAFRAFQNYSGKNELMVLGVGTAAGGPVKAGKDAFLTDASGRRVFSRLDVDALKRLKDDSDVQVATLTVDDGDVQWIQRRIQTHLQQKLADAEARWRDFGWYLMIPITLLSALWFRRGRTIRWMSILLLGLALTAPDRASAADEFFVDAFLSQDQQGRRAFEQGDYAAAAEHFADPMWRGTALYRAGRYDDAVDAFALIDTADSWYNQGNALARANKLPAAVAAYQEALQRRPGWPQAKQNLALIQALIAQEKKKDDDQDEPGDEPDQITFDDRGKRGKRGQVEMGEQTAEMWMRNIQTTPAQLLQRKFAIQAKDAGP
jgi:Ca-activated chloride channel homolog